jgi:hypothetical protein
MDHPERTQVIVPAGSFATYLGNPGLAEFLESGVSQLTNGGTA